MTAACTRKKMTERQAQLVAQRVGMQTGVRRYAVWCGQCRAYHITKGE